MMCCHQFSTLVSFRGDDGKCFNNCMGRHTHSHRTRFQGGPACFPHINFIYQLFFPPTHTFSHPLTLPLPLRNNMINLPPPASSKFQLIFLLIICVAVSGTPVTRCGQSDGGDRQVRSFLRCTCAEEKCDSIWMHATRPRWTRNACKYCERVCGEVSHELSNEHKRKNCARAAVHRCFFRRNDADWYNEYKEYL